MLTFFGSKPGCGCGVMTRGVIITHSPGPNVTMKGMDILNGGKIYYELEKIPFEDNSGIVEQLISTKAKEVKVALESKHVSILQNGTPLLEFDLAEIPLSISTSYIAYFL